MTGGRNGNPPAAHAMRRWRVPFPPSSASLPWLPRLAQIVPLLREKPAHRGHVPAESTPRTVRAATAPPATGFRPASMPQASIHSVAWHPTSPRGDPPRPCSPPARLEADMDGVVAPPIATPQASARRSPGLTDTARRIPGTFPLHAAMRWPSARPKHPTPSPRWLRPWDRGGGHGGSGRRRHPLVPTPGRPFPPLPPGARPRTRSAHARTAAHDAVQPQGSAWRHPPTQPRARPAPPMRQRRRRRRVPRRSKVGARSAGHSRCLAGTRPSPWNRLAPASARPAWDEVGKPSHPPTSRGPQVSGLTSAIAWPMVSSLAGRALGQHGVPVPMALFHAYLFADDGGMGGSGRGSKREGSRTTWRMRLRFHV